MTANTHQYCNTAELLKSMAELYGNRDAILAPFGLTHNGRSRFRKLTFSELDSLANSYAGLFCVSGLTKGMKVLMMMHPGLEFTAAVFAVFRTGAIPVLIDPGMGRQNFLGCVAQTAPDAMISIPVVHWLRPLFRQHFSSVKLAFSCGIGSPPWVIGMERAATPMSIKKRGKVAFSPVAVSVDDPAAILFTTGSTGAPKGVLYSHRTFLSQVDIIRQVYGAGPEHVDMSAFPLFALFAVALGMKTIVPHMDFTRPAKVDPRVVISIVRSQRVTFSFGSPALWRTVGKYCRKHGETLPTLKLVLMAGAPVGAELHELVGSIIAADGATRVPYGATEALPITDFCGAEVLRDTAARTAMGEGHCVGTVNDGITIRIIAATDAAIPHWDESLALPSGEKGEIVVKGDVVTTMYYNRADATRLSKIADSDGQVWHRMGDMGYFDEQNRLWFCGRKNHRVITAERIYYSVCTEAVFNNHPDVFRSALVGVVRGGVTVPVLWVEPRRGKMPHGDGAIRRFIHGLREKAQGVDICAGIDDFLFMKDFPVDIRHNAKIFREKLTVEAEKRLGCK